MNDVGGGGGGGRVGEGDLGSGRSECDTRCSIESLVAAGVGGSGL